MTRTSSEIEGEDSSPIAKISSQNLRNEIIKVRVTSLEKKEIARQKGRLSFSAFLRDRGINKGDVYDPTYAAIGSVYQSARNLLDSCRFLENASLDLEKAAADLVGPQSPVAAHKIAVQACEQICGLASSLKSQGERIEAHAIELSDQARGLSREHMHEMLKRYPAQAIKTRDHR